MPGSGVSFDDDIPVFPFSINIIGSDSDDHFTGTTVINDFVAIAVFPTATSQVPGVDDLTFI